MKFFSKVHSNSASTFVSPEGLHIILSTTKNGQTQCYGPGSVIQGRVHVNLNRPIFSPCQLRVIFTCNQTILPSKSGFDSSSSSSQSSPSIASRSLIRRCSHSPQGKGNSSLVFEVEHLLLQNQILPACRRQGIFHFLIKLPLCNFPPSIQTGDRTISYSICAHLGFETEPGNTSSWSWVSSHATNVMYLPMVPMTLPTASVKRATATTTAPSTVFRYSTTIGTTNEAHAQIVVDYTSMTPHAEIRGSIKSIAGVRICETAALVLRIDNQSQIDLRSIHLALVRCVSFASELSDASHASSTIYDYTPPEPTIVHNATIPIAKVSNANSSWSQQLQLRLPFSTEIVPTINASVTPLLRVDYFILVSIPVPQRHNNLVSRFTSSTRKRPTIDLSIFNRSISSSFRERLSTDTPSPNISHTDNDTYEQLHQLLLSPEPTVLSAIKGAPMALQFPPIPILVGTIPSIASQRKSP